VVAVQSNPVYLPPFSGCFLTGIAAATDKRYPLCTVPSYEQFVVAVRLETA